MLRETLDEYLITYENLTDKLNRMDTRIEELASLPRYKEKVKKLTCFIGVKTQTALATIVEISDFNRFAKAEKYASYLGLVPGENSSGDKQIRLRITKAGNTHVRKLMVEAAHSYGRGHIGYKPKALKARQFGNTPETIAYADRANERLRRRYYKLISRGMKRNVAITAIARELSCFMWGLMTDNIA
jgi:transposase